MSSFTVSNDGRYRYYNNALEAILRYAEAKDECTQRAAVYGPGSKLLASYTTTYDTPTETVYVPQQEWFNL